MLYLSRDASNETTSENWKNITSHDSYFLHIKNLENQYFLNVYLNMDYWTNNGYGMNGCGWKVVFFFGGISQLVDFSPKMKKYMKILWFLDLFAIFEMKIIKLPTSRPRIS
jgi:hypothetical protein